MTETSHGETEAEPRILRGLRLAIELTIVIFVVEAVGAYLSRSLSLTVDAVHDVPDLFAFTASWAALRATEQGASTAYTFGTHRFEVFAGLFNAGIVLAVGLGFAFLAVEAFRAGTPFAGSVVAIGLLATAVPTLGLRATNVYVLRRVPGRARDLNLRGVLVHLASDLVIVGALLVAGVVLLWLPGAWWADLGAAAFIGVTLIWESLPLFRSAWEVLGEGVPAGLSVEAITDAALQVPSVSEIHDVHVWAVCPTLVCLTAHIQLGDMSVRDSMQVVARLRKVMEEQFGIVHAVFEVEAHAVRLPPR